MKRVLTLILVALIVALAMVFGKLNATPVDVDFFFHTLSGWPLGFWLLLFFLAGMILAGVLVYVQLWFSLRRRLREVKRQSTEEKPDKVPAAVPRLEAGGDE